MSIQDVFDALKDAELALIELQLEVEENDPDQELVFGDREEEIERLRAENLRLREIIRRQESAIRKMHTKRARSDAEAETQDDPMRLSL